MSAPPTPLQGQIVSVGTSATLLYQTVDGETWATLTGTNIFVARTPNDPLTLTLVLPASASLYFGGSSVTTSNGAEITVGSGGPLLIPVSLVGSASLYAVVSSSSVSVGVIVTNHV